MVNESKAKNFSCDYEVEKFVEYTMSKWKVCEATNYKLYTLVV